MEPWELTQPQLDEIVDEAAHFGDPLGRAIATAAVRKVVEYIEENNLSDFEDVIDGVAVQLNCEAWAALKKEAE